MAKKTVFAGFKPTRRGVPARPHRVAVVAFDGVVLGDLATPLEVFGLARSAEGRPCYEVRTCSQQPQVESAHVTLQAPWRLSSLKRAETVIVPGIDNIERPIPQELLSALRAVVSRRTRVASICTGAFILARTARLTDSKRRRIGSRLRNWPGVIPQSTLTPTCSTSTTGHIDVGRRRRGFRSVSPPGATRSGSRNCGPCRSLRSDAARAFGRTGSVYCLRATCCYRVDGTTGHDADPVDCGGACPPRTAIVGNHRPVNRAGRRRSGIQIGIRVAGAFRRNRGNDAPRLPARLREREIP